MERRKVLFTFGKGLNTQLIITDAPKEAIEKWCVFYNQFQKESQWCELFCTLKTSYYVKELLDSEVDDIADVDIIGYDECYDYGDFSDSL